MSAPWSAPRAQQRANWRKHLPVGGTHSLSHGVWGKELNIKEHRLNLQP